jgi:hypothetical protein
VSVIEVATPFIHNSTFSIDSLSVEIQLIETISDTEPSAMNVIVMLGGVVSYAQLSSSYVAVLSKLIANESVQPQILSPPVTPAQSLGSCSSSQLQNPNPINNSIFKNRILNPQYLC